MAAAPPQSSQPSLLRVLYTIQGEENDAASSSASAVPNCFLMDRPPSGLLKAHDVLARFPPAAAAAEVRGVGCGCVVVLFLCVGVGVCLCVV